MLISVRCHGLLNFNTFGRNFNPVYDTLNSHNFCHHNCDYEYYGTIPYKKGPFDPCCQDHLEGGGVSSSYCDICDEESSTG